MFHQAGKFHLNTSEVQVNGIKELLSNKNAQKVLLQRCFENQKDNLEEISDDEMVAKTVRHFDIFEKQVNALSKQLNSKTNQVGSSHASSFNIKNNFNTSSLLQKQKENLILPKEFSHKQGQFVQHQQKYGENEEMSTNRSLYDKEKEVSHHAIDKSNQIPIGKKRQCSQRSEQSDSVVQFKCDEHSTQRNNELTDRSKIILLSNRDKKSSSNQILLQPSRMENQQLLQPLQLNCQNSQVISSLHTQTNILQHIGRSKQLPLNNNQEDQFQQDQIKVHVNLRDDSQQSETKLQLRQFQMLRDVLQDDGIVLKNHQKDQTNKSQIEECNDNAKMVEKRQTFNNWHLSNKTFLTDKTILNEQKDFQNKYSLSNKINLNKPEGIFLHQQQDPILQQIQVCPQSTDQAGIVGNINQFRQGKNFTQINNKKEGSEQQYHRKREIKNNINSRSLSTYENITRCQKNLESRPQSSMLSRSLACDNSPPSNFDKKKVIRGIQKSWQYKSLQSSPQNHNQPVYKRDQDNLDTFKEMFNEVNVERENSISEGRMSHSYIFNCPTQNHYSQYQNKVKYPETKEDPVLSTNSRRDNKCMEEIQEQIRYLKSRSASMDMTIASDISQLEQKVSHIFKKIKLDKYGKGRQTPDNFLSRGSSNQSFTNLSQRKRISACTTTAVTSHNSSSQKPSHSYSNQFAEKYQSDDMKYNKIQGFNNTNNLKSGNISSINHLEKKIFPQVSQQQWQFSSQDSYLEQIGRQLEPSQFEFDEIRECLEIDCLHNNDIPKINKKDVYNQINYHSHYQPINSYYPPERSQLPLNDKIQLEQIKDLKHQENCYQNDEGYTNCQQLQHKQIDMRDKIILNQVQRQSNLLDFKELDLAPSVILCTTTESNQTDAREQTLKSTQEKQNTVPEHKIRLIDLLPKKSQKICQYQSTAKKNSQISQSRSDSRNSFHQSRAETRMSNNYLHSEENNQSELKKTKESMNHSILSQLNRFDSKENNNSYLVQSDWRMNSEVDELSGNCNIKRNENSLKKKRLFESNQDLHNQHEYNKVLEKSYLVLPSKKDFQDKVPRSVSQSKTTKQQQKFQQQQEQYEYNHKSNLSLDPFLISGKGKGQYELRVHQRSHTLDKISSLESQQYPNFMTNLLKKQENQVNDNNHEIQTKRSKIGYSLASPKIPHKKEGKFSKKIKVDSEISNCLKHLNALSIDLNNQSKATKNQLKMH